ncbi:MAG: O-antigen ligase family protein [Phycisphaerae bacterium]
MWPLRTMFYFAAFWLACMAALVNPIWGVLNYLMVYQMNPVDTWWGVPIADFGVRYSLVAISFIILGLLLSGKKTPPLTPNLSAWEVGAILLLVIAAVNLLIGFEYGQAARFAFEKLWKMFVFVFILARLITTRENLRLVMWTIVGGSFYLGYDAYTAPSSSFESGRLEHIGGADFSTTSGFAAHLSAMLPLVGAMFLTAKTKKTQFTVAIVGAFVVNAIIMCRTRSAFIGLLIGTVVAMMFAPRAKRFRIHALLIGAGIAGYSLTDAAFWTRMHTLTSTDTLSTDPAAETRLAIWGASLEIIADHPEGIGIGNFPRIIGNYDWNLYKRTSHNTVLKAFVELGIHGGVIFLLMVLGSLRYTFLCRRLADRTDDPLETKYYSYGMLVSCVTYFITGLGTERFQCESFWWVMVLPLCLYRVVRQEVREREAARMEYANAEAYNVTYGGIKREGQSPARTVDVIPSLVYGVDRV